MPTKSVGGRSRSSKKLAVISDLHDGGLGAICSEPTNVFQRVLLALWEETIQDIGHCDLLLLNGEPIQGENKKELGNENWTSDINEQIKDAIKLVRMWKYKKLFVTRGSKYHGQQNQTSFEETFARQINATPYINGVYGKDLKTWWWCNFYMNDRLFNACHHLRMARAFFYLTTPLQREMSEMIFNRGKYYGTSEHIDCIVRSHTHRALHIRHPHQFGFQTGCWQFPNEYLMRFGLGGTFPTLGCASVTVEPNGEMFYNEHVLHNDEIPKIKAVEI